MLKLTGKKMSGPSSATPYLLVRAGNLGKAFQDRSIRATGSNEDTPMTVCASWLGNPCSGHRRHTAKLACVALSALMFCNATSAETTVSPLTDLGTLDRPDSPNTWLVGPPPGSSSPPPDAPAPVFDVPASQLASTWRQLIVDQSRTRETGLSEDGLQIEAEHASALFGFVDDISFRAVPLGTDRSTFIAYSRSRVGYWDLGANRRRLDAWTGILRDMLASPR